MIEDLLNEDGGLNEVFKRGEIMNEVFKRYKL